MTVALRPYQAELVERAADAFRAGHRRVLIQAPTGSGKGRIIAHLAARATRKAKRVVVVAQRGLILDQIAGNLTDEGVASGRVQAGHELVDASVQLAMVQSLARRLERIRAPDLAIVDEAHHAAAASYRALLAAWPMARVVGMSATPVRTDGRGLRDAFDVLIEGPTIADLVGAGHLARIAYYEPGAPDLGGVRVVRGEFDAAAALEAVRAANLTGSAIEHYLLHLAGRPAIAFTLGVDEADRVAVEFRQAGIRAASIAGTTLPDERTRLLAALAGGELHVLVSADLIGEGIDVPAVAGVLLLRPTSSVTVHLQQVGRALRPKADGSEAVILDHAGNAARLGYPTDERRWTLDGVERVAAAVRICSRCSRTFPSDQARELATAGCRVAATEGACLMLAPPRPGEVRKPLTTVSGQLRRVRDPLAWAGGISLERARGAEWRLLLERAESEAQLRMIARARGFRRGWTQHVLRDRAAAV